MIDNVFVFLRNRLNNYLKLASSPEDSLEDPVVFINGQDLDPLVFKLGAVSLLLINLEEEKSLNPPDRYSRLAADGTPEQVQPPIKLNLYILFVARFRQYEDSLRYLSQIIRYFQHYHYLDHQNAPDLSESIDKLVIELVTPSIGEQNSIWSALRVSYHPSALYRIKMVVFQDEDAAGVAEISERSLRIQQ